MIAGMQKLESAALELLEYKLDDLLNRRIVRGGVSSVWSLYQQLSRDTSELDEDERKRLGNLGRQLRMLGEAPMSLTASARSFDDLVLDSDDGGAEPMLPGVDGKKAVPAVRLIDPAALDVSPAAAAASSASDTASTRAAIDMERQYSGERSALQKLATNVWWYELDRFITQLAASLRAERDRYTARLLYATHRNLMRFSGTGEYDRDVNLSRFRVIEAIPARDDALVSVDDLDSLSELVREVISTIMNLGEPGTPLAGLELPRDQAIDFVRRAALAVAADPYAGSHTLLKRNEPNSEQLRMAIQELGKEWMREEERLSQRRELEQRLQAVLAYERHQRQVFERDVSNFTGLVQAFFDKVSRFLPASVGGQASGPQLQGGVLNARNPLIRMDEVPDGATQITVCAARPVRFRLAGQELAVRQSEGVRSLNVGGQEVRVDREFTVETGRGRLHVFAEGDYLHLRFEDFSRSLSALVAEALAAHHVLTSDHRTEMLTVLRILANSLVGEPQELVRQALKRLAALSASAPKRRVAIEGFLRGSARAAKVDLPDSAVLGLVQRFHTAMTVGPADLNALLERLTGAEASVYPLTGEPLSISVGNSSLTVRQYRGRGEAPQESMVVMLPGRTLGSFTDYLIEPLGVGTLICVRGDQELAVIYMKDGTLRSPTTA